MVYAEIIQLFAELPVWSMRVGTVRQMTGYRYVIWRDCTRPAVANVTTAVLFGFSGLCSPRVAGAIELPRPSAREALHDHPIVSLCIIILLCLLCAVLHLSRIRIKASERRYRALFQDNGAIMILVDPVSLRIMDANPAACAFYGWSPADFLNKRIVDITTTSEAAVREIYHDVINFEKRRFQARHRLASGDQREMEVNAMPYGIDGKECILSIIHDMTNERKESGRVP